MDTAHVSGGSSNPPTPGTTQHPADLYELLEGCQHGQATCVGPADGPICILEPQLKHRWVSSLGQAGPHRHRVCRDMLQAQGRTVLASPKAGQQAEVPSCKRDGGSAANAQICSQTVTGSCPSNLAVSIFYCLTIKSTYRSAFQGNRDCTRRRCAGQQHAAASQPVGLMTKGLPHGCPTPPFR